MSDVVVVVSDRRWRTRRMYCGVKEEMLMKGW